MLFGSRCLRYQRSMFQLERKHQDKKERETSQETSQRSTPLPGVQRMPKQPIVVQVRYNFNKKICRINRASVGGGHPGDTGVASVRWTSASIEHEKKDSETLTDSDMSHNKTGRHRKEEGDTPKDTAGKLPKSFSRTAERSQRATAWINTTLTRSRTQELNSRRGGGNWTHCGSLVNVQTSPSQNCLFVTEIHVFYNLWSCTNQHIWYEWIKWLFNIKGVSAVTSSWTELLRIMLVMKILSW